jgi:hypothetical protein
MDHHRWQVDSSAGFRRLWLVEPQFPAHLTELVLHGKARRFEVEVGPLRPEQFSLAEAGGDGQHLERLQPVTLCGVEQAGGLLG